MAARGILRLGNQIGLSKQHEWNISRILIQTLQSHHTRSSQGKALVSSNESSTRQRCVHTVVPCVSGLVLHRKLCYDQHREYKTSTFQDNDDSTEQDEVNGDFNKFNISEVTQEKLRSMGINYLFPVQYCTFKPTKEGTDVIVQARTGTGKTLSFALPLVEKLQQNADRLRQRGRKPLVLVLAPTRELANQVKDVFYSLSDKVQMACVYGGVSVQPQIEAVRRGVDVIVGTPGRIRDLMEQGVLDLSELEHVILDEVDTMLDMGFADQVENIIRDCYTSGQKPQTMLYSATMPDWVKQTARRYLDDDYEMINLVGKQAEQTATTIKQYAVMCRASEQPSLIMDFIHMYVKSNGRVIVFCQTKKEVQELCSGVLHKEAKAFHGDIAQASRSYILKGFRDGVFKVLVTTDVAARGLDIPNIDLVIQAQPPNDTSFYIHRVGRTGRAGQSGMSILLYQPSQVQEMKECERLAKVKFEKIKPPNTEQLLELCVKQAVSDIVNVPEELSSHFTEAAELMMEKKMGTRMLSAAMALVSKAETYFNRSFITRQVGYNTLKYSEGTKMRSARYARDKIRAYLGELNVSIQNIHILKDGSGVVFDVETDSVQQVLKGFDDIKSSQSESIERVSELPDLVEDRKFEGLPNHGRHGRPFQRTRQNRDFYADEDEEGDDFESYFGRNSKPYRSNYNRYERDSRSYNRSSAKYNDRHNTRYSDRHADSGYNTFRSGDRGQYSRDSKQRKQNLYEFSDDE